MNKAELNNILNLHKLWFNGDPKGRRASLPDANLWNANLEFANLAFANLAFANLECANLAFANLRDANLRGASLECANLAFANLRGATFNKKTVFPEGFDPIARGMIFVGEEQEEEKEPAAPSTSEQEKEETVAAGTAVPTTLSEELSVLFAKHGLELVSFNFSAKTKS